MKSNGATPPTPPETEQSVNIVPPAAAQPEMNWRLIAQTAMQQRDRANQLAYNLEIDLIMARAQVEALEKASGMTAAAALARQELGAQAPSTAP